MPSRRKRFLKLVLKLTILVVFLAAGFGGLIAGGWLDRRGPLDHLQRSAARTIDLRVTVNAPGEIQSTHRTMIECELENLRISGGGVSLRATGGSTIIELVDDGSIVQAGDVLCRLDASEYEELVYQQEIKVQQARADLAKAELDLKAREIAYREYTEGSLSQQRESYAEQRILHEADIQRQQDRIRWSEKMLANGYISEDKLQRERENLLRSQINLTSTLARLSTLENYSAPIQTKRLEAAVDRAREEVSYQQLRLLNREDQLEQFQRQVERCTILAPHDGMVIYANERTNEPQVFLGATVRQRMKLFYLPDLGDMEVHTMLHESIVDRVKLGQSSLVRIEALPKQLLEGHVTAISPLPLLDTSRRATNEVKNFLAKIQLHSFPRGLMPGMSAEVEILTEHRPEALVVPVSAVSVKQGKSYLYVSPRPDVLERREVRLSPGTIDVVHVTDGLDEGEEIVLDWKQVEGDPALASIATTALPEAAEATQPTDSPSLVAADSIQASSVDNPVESGSFATQ